GASGGPGHHGAVTPGVQQRGPHEAVLEDGAEMEGRPAAEVQESSLAYLLGERLVLGVAAVEGQQTASRSPAGGEPPGGGLDRPFRMFVGSRSRKDENLGPPADLPQLLVERAPVSPLGAANQGERAGLLAPLIRHWFLTAHWALTVAAWRVGAGR